MKRNQKRRLFVLFCFAVAALFFRSAPVCAEGVIKIDANKKYKGMNASFAKGYMPSVKKNALYLVIPFRMEGAEKGERLWVGISFEREENCPFYFKNYQTQVKPKKSGVYLYKCKIKLKKDRINGQYPLRLYAMGKTAEGMVREEFIVYVEISDGRTASFVDEGIPEGKGESEMQQEMLSGNLDIKEEIIRQPRILLEKNSLQNESILAGSSILWNLAVKNCSAEQAAENMKVTISCENKDILFEKNTWYFKQIRAGAEMDLSQSVTVGKKALPEAVPVQFQFEYEDKKGTAYSSTETVSLSVMQTQQAELVNFLMPESFYESDTELVTFQILNTGLAAIYNARVRLEGAGLFADEIFLGNIEAGALADGEMQIFAGTLNMDEQGEIEDETAKKYGDVAGRIIFSFENEQGEIVEQEQPFSTAIKKPQTIELKIEEEKKQETNQWWITSVVLVIFVMLLMIFWLYLRMRYYQRCAYEKTKYL